jgi:hypothetical protein
VLAGQLELQVELLELLAHPLEEAGEVGAAVLALGEELVPHLELLLVVAQPLQRLLAALEGAALLQDGLALLGVVPEAGRLDGGVDLGELLSEVGLLKGTPGEW